MSYGGPVPALTYTVVGFVPGGDQAYSGAPQMTATATAASTPGHYTIVPSNGTLASPNYGFAFAPAPLLVNQATLLVTPNNASKTYGSVNPALTYTITGYVNGDQNKSGVVTGAAVLSTPVLTGSAVGQYPITVNTGTLAASNYTIDWVLGEFTVNPAPIWITANNQSMTYGFGLPALSVRIYGLVNGDAATAIAGLPAVSTTATSKPAVGIYPITVGIGTLTASNYSIQLGNGVLQVNKAALTATANN
jgi:hypothetical protein